MDTKICIEMCHVVFTDQPVGTKWYLLEHGTILRTHVEAMDEHVIEAMGKLAEALGPYSGEGSKYGDCNPMKLNKFPGWLVSFPAFPVITYVDPEEMEGAPSPSPTERFLAERAVAGRKISSADDLLFDVRVAVFGRHKRNLDARNPKIIARSTDALVP